MNEQSGDSFAVDLLSHADCRKSQLQPPTPLSFKLKENRNIVGLAARHNCCSIFNRKSGSRRQTNITFIGGTSLLLPLAPKSPREGAWIGIFQPNAQNIQTFVVIKTTAAIATKFCIEIEIAKYSSRVVPECASQIQDGGRPPSWKKTLRLCCSYTICKLASFHS